MSTYKLSNGNTIVADAAFVAANYPDAVLVPDPAPIVPLKQWPGLDFLRRFTQAERISARTLANTDPYAYDFWHLLDSAIASGTPIYANDPDVVAGMAYLSANPASGPVLAAGRSTAILSA